MARGREGALVHDRAASHPPAWKAMREVNSALGSRASSLMLTHCLASTAGQVDGGERKDEEGRPRARSGGRGGGAEAKGG